MGSIRDVACAAIALGLIFQLRSFFWPVWVTDSDFDDVDRASDFYQCDRECRWRYGFFNRSIIGKRSKEEKDMCKCYYLEKDSVRPFDDGNTIPRFSKKAFDSGDTWSGDFVSDFVCTSSASGILETMTREHALSSGKEILHCGKCAVCSSKQDIAVLPLTRKWITEVMTAASSKFAKPEWMGGTGDLLRLQSNLHDLGMNFSRAPQPEFGGTSCMECWTDNIMSDAITCKGMCWIKFFTPSNPRTDITHCKPWDFNCLCLKCDEDYSGAQFIKCAGANRRSSGIVSDIARPEYQKCKVAMYYGVTDSDLPTAPKPTREEIERVLNRKPS